jgi:hypothetical protein
MALADRHSTRLPLDFLALARSVPKPNLVRVEYDNDAMAKAAERLEPPDDGPGD